MTLLLLLLNPLEELFGNVGVPFEVEHYDFVANWGLGHLCLHTKLLLPSRRHFLHLAAGHNHTLALVVLLHLETLITLVQFLVNADTRLSGTALQGRILNLVVVGHGIHTSAFNIERLRLYFL